MGKPLKLPLKHTKSDADRREKQAQHFVRIIQVHRLLKTTRTQGEIAQTIADELKCSARTVYRDIKVLNDAYEIIGSEFLDK